MYRTINHPLSIISEKPETEELSALPLSQKGSVSFNSAYQFPSSNNYSPSAPRFNSANSGPLIRISYENPSNMVMRSEIIGKKKPSFNTLFEENKNGLPDAMTH